MAKRKKTTYVSDYVRALYKRERERVQKTVRRYKKKGYTVDVDVPKIPQTVTFEAVRELRNISLDEIKENTYVDVNPETYQRTNVYGEIKIYKPKGAAKIPNETNISIDQFIDLIKDYPERARGMAEKWLQKLINTQGIEAASEVLAYGLEHDKFLSPKKVWSDQKNGYPVLAENLAQMSKYLDLSGGEYNQIFSEIEEEYGTDFGFYFD